eukprot:234514_1
MTESKWASRGKILVGTAVAGKVAFEFMKWATTPSFNDDNFIINEDLLSNIQYIGKHASKIDMNNIGNACNEMKRIYQSNITRKLSNRKVQLQNLLNLLTENQDEIVNALYEDLGRDRFLAIAADIGAAKSSIKYLLKNLETLNKPQRIGMSVMTFPAIEYTVYEPFGTVFINAIWNFPFGTLFGPIGGAIAAGNNVIIKPCNTASKCSRVITDLLHKYVDSRFVQVLGGHNIANGNDYKITDKILENQFDFIFFTGSTNGGKYIMEKAAKNLTPVLLELGGKNPTIVDESANIEKTVRQVLCARTMNCGQMCISPDYVLCHKDKMNEFLEKAKLTLDIWGKDSKHEYVGKIVSDKQFMRVIDMLKKTKGDIIYGGKYDKNSRRIEPTIVRVNDWNDYGMSQETFGPVLWVKEVNDVKEAVDYVNKQEKSLSLYMFSENRKNQDYVANNTSSGGMQINGAAGYISNPNVGFGGVGNSGIGQYHGAKTFHTFCHSKPVVRNLGEMKLIYPPRDGWKLKLVSYL